MSHASTITIHSLRRDSEKKVLDERLFGISMPIMCIHTHPTQIAVRYRYNIYMCVCVCVLFCVNPIYLLQFIDRDRLFCLFVQGAMRICLSTHHINTIHSQKIIIKHFNSLLSKTAAAKILFCLSTCYFDFQMLFFIFVLWTLFVKTKNYWYWDNSYRAGLQSSVIGFFI